MSATTTKHRPPLGLPRGSVRAFLALCVAGTAYWLIARPGALPDGVFPPHLAGALPIALGYYFAHRAGGGDARLGRSDGASPLWLPAGSVRLLLMIGFVAAVGYHVVRAGLADLRALAPIVLDLGLFFAGQVVAMISERLNASGKRATLFTTLGHLGAAVGIVSGIGLVVVHCVPSAPLPAAVRERMDDVFPLIISFYFGARR